MTAKSQKVLMFVSNNMQNNEWSTVVEPKNFQNRLSSAETQQPVDRMQRKARGCLVLSVLC